MVCKRGISMLRYSPTVWGAVMCWVLFSWTGSYVGAAPTAEDLERAPVLKEEKLLVFGSANVKGPIPVLNPDGKTYDLLLNYGDYANILVGESLVVVDTSDGSVTLHRTPAGVSFHSVLLGGRVVGPDGKLYMMVRDDRGERLMTVWVYDPASNTLKALGAPSKSLPTPGGVTPMTLADDGIIYGAGTGRDRRIAAYSLDPKTGTFRDFGLLGPPHTRGGSVQTRSVRKFGDYLYVTSGKVPWYLIALNLKTREQKVVLEGPAGNCQIFFRGNVLRLRPDPKDPRKERLYDVVGDKVVPLKDPKESRWKAKSGPKPPPVPELAKNLLVPRPDGTSVLGYRMPGEKTWRRVEFKVPVYPQKLWRLTALPDGRLLGRAGSHLWSYIYDTKTDTLQPLGTMFALEQFAPAVVHPNGKIYLTGYAGSPFFEFDPNRPWTPESAEPGTKPIPLDAPESNPRLLVSFHELMMTKVITATALGSDGRVYVGGKVMREGNGGGFGWWDPKTSKAAHLPRERFFGQEINQITAVYGGDKIVLTSSVTVDNRTGKTPDTAKVYVFDVKRGRITHELEPIPRAKRYTKLVEVAPGRLVGAATPLGWREYYGSRDGKDFDLFLLDLQKRKVVLRRKAPAPVWAFQRGYRDGEHFVRGPDGFVWTYMGKERARPALVRIAPETLEITVVGRVNGMGPMAFVNNDLYRGCEMKAGQDGLRRARNIVPGAD